VDNLYWLDQIQSNQHLQVGDRTLHLSHLAQKGYPVIPGFAISAQWFREFLDGIEWSDPLFLDLAKSSLRINVEDARQLQAVAQQIRHTIVAAPLPTQWMVELEATVRALPPVMVNLQPSKKRRFSIKPLRPLEIDLRSSLN
jgi:pyruvate,water dikinase